MVFSSAFSGVARAGLMQDEQEFTKDFTKATDRLRTALRARGFTELGRKPITTGNLDHHGGLRVDADMTMLSPATFVIQPVARIDDISERGRTDLLPWFHVVGCQAPNDADVLNQAEIALSILVNDFGLDPGRLAFASVPAVEVMRGSFESVGFDFDAKVHIRDDDAARKARDSSGYFYPVPEDPEFFVRTLGIYYRLTDEGENRLSAYPPTAEWTEIAEFTIDGVNPGCFAFGLERLALAARGFYTSWDQRVPELIDLIETDRGEIEMGETITRFKNSIGSP